jgi:hypothetical protein
MKKTIYFLSNQSNFFMSNIVRSKKEADKLLLDYKLSSYTFSQSVHIVKQIYQNCTLIHTYHYV